MRCDVRCVQEGDIFFLRLAVRVPPVTGQRVVPALPSVGDHSEASSYETFVFTFDPVATTGIRLTGTAGSAKISNCPWGGFQRLWQYPATHLRSEALTSRHAGCAHHSSLRVLLPFPTAPGTRVKDGLPLVCGAQLHGAVVSAVPQVSTCERVLEGRREAVRTRGHSSSSGTPLG